MKQCHDRLMISNENLEHSAVATLNRRTDFDPYAQSLIKEKRIISSNNQRNHD
jgi:hypothetical protein